MTLSEATDAAVGSYCTGQPKAYRERTTHPFRNIESTVTNKRIRPVVGGQRDKVKVEVKTNLEWGRGRGGEGRGGGEGGGD